MKLIESSVNIIPQQPGIIGALKQVEIAARNCYKSEEKITEDSYKSMIDQLITKGHYSPFEQGTVYLTIMLDQFEDESSMWEIFNFYYFNKYSKVIEIFELINEQEICVGAAITTNLRVIYENKREDDLEYFTEPTIHEKAVTVRFITQRVTADSIMRHRMSICTESTRFCNYNKDKFGNELIFVIPEYFNKEIIPNSQFSYDVHIDYWQKSENPQVSNYLQSLAWSEKNYLTMIRNGMQPQIARGVLPLDVKSEVVMTGQLWQWKNFFNMRCSHAAHPDVRVLAENLKQQFINNNLIDK